MREVDSKSEGDKVRKSEKESEGKGRWQERVRKSLRYIDNVRDKEREGEGEIEYERMRG